MISRRSGIAAFFIVNLVVILAAALAPPRSSTAALSSIRRPARMAGIPNFGDVASNLPFAAVGIWGLWFVWSEPGRRQFLEKRERWPYALGFFGLLLTAFESSYYHLDRITRDLCGTGCR